MSTTTLNKQHYEHVLGTLSNADLRWLQHRCGVKLHQRQAASAEHKTKRSPQEQRAMWKARFDQECG